MKKHKKKPIETVNAAEATHSDAAEEASSSESVSVTPEKGEMTQEMDAIMEAASADSAEDNVLLTDSETASDTKEAEKTDSSESVDSSESIDSSESSDSEEAVSEIKETTEAEASASPQACEEAPAEKAESEVPAEDSTGRVDESEEAEESGDSSESGYKKLGLYLHVPFCKSKCAYCDFYSTDKITCRGSGGIGSNVPDEMKQYVTAIKNHMRILSERTTQYNIDTIFIGGGTPTALPEKLLLDMIKEIDRCFYLEDGYEFTVEMNPATASAHLLKKLRRAGVNRLSIGLQSAHNHELAALSRIHTVGDFTECFQMAREAGFDNINIDVMYGIPEQTRDSFAETLAFIASMKPEHISMYNLRIEENTPFGEKKHMLPLPDEDSECDMYFNGIAYLEEQGYHQYEISNFARAGRECRHNLKYWHGEEYLGCGPAAHSYFGQNRFSLRASLPLYCKALAVKGKSIPSSLLDENYSIDKKEEIAEYLMLRLRLREGIEVSDFNRRFGGDFDAVFGKRLQIYIDRGLMTHENNRYAFTPQGMFVSNYILARIIPFEPKLSNHV